MNRNDPDWRDIPGFGGAYQISREGEVRTWRYRKDRFLKEPKPMVQFMRKSGNNGRARYVKLTDADGKSKDFAVLGLMAKVWLGGAPPGTVPYHKNGDLADHCINNIGFATRKEIGKMFAAGAARIPVAKISSDGEFVEFYPSARAAARANHLSYQAVLDRCNGRIKKPFALDGYSYASDQ